MEDQIQFAPSFMYAASSHSVGNGGFSLVEPDTWGEGIVRAEKFTVSAITRAVASTLNIAPDVGNWLGKTFTGESPNFERISTEDTLRRFDDNLADYYVENQNSVNIAGDVIASFGPGIAGIRVLNRGQTALAALGGEGMGWNLARSIGTLPALQAETASAAAAAAKSGSIFGAINANLAKSIGYGYAQSALETAAFEVAASTALNQSPIFDSHSSMDVLKNALYGGGFIGGGILGTVVAVQTTGMVRRALTEAEKKFNPFSVITQLQRDDNVAANLYFGFRDLDNAMPIPETFSATEAAKAERLIADREKNLSVRILGDLNKITNGDSTLASEFFTTLRGLSGEERLQRIAYLTESTRAGLRTDTELAISALEKGIRKAASTAGFDEVKLVELYDELSKYNVTTLKLHGENAGITTSATPEVITLADRYTSPQEMYDAIKKYKFSTVKQYDPMEAVDYIESQARNIWAKSVPLEEGTIIGANDIALMKRAYELGHDEIRIAGRLDPITRNEFPSFLEAKVYDLAEDLFSRSKSGTKTASIDTLTARLKNKFGQHIEVWPQDKIDELVSNARGFYQLAESGPEGILKIANRTVIAQEVLQGDSFDKVMRTLAHEEGHSKTVKYLAAQQIQHLPQEELQLMKDEAIRLSKQARPYLWKSKDPELIGYRESISELLADAYSRFALGKAKPENFPSLSKHFSQEFRKIELGNEYTLASRELSNAEVAQWLDVKEHFLTGTRNVKDPYGDVSALTAYSREYSDGLRSTGRLLDENVKTWELPQYVKLGYQIPQTAIDTTGHVVDALVYYKQLQNLWKEDAVLGLTAVTNRLGANSGSFLDFSTEGATSADSGASAIKFASGNYLGLGSISEWVGSQTNKLKLKGAAKVNETFMAHEYHFRNTPESARELGIIRQKLLSTGERYVINEDGNLVAKSLKEWEDSAEAFRQAGKEFTVPRPVISGDEIIPVTRQNVREFLSDWTSFHDDYLTAKSSVSNAKRTGFDPSRNKGVVYFPPPDPKEFTHYAFAVDNSVLGQGHVQMIWAANATELEQLVEKAKEVGKHIDVHYQRDTEQFKKALGIYERQAGITDTFYDAAMSRAGTAAPFFPQLEGGVLMDSLMGYRRKAEVSLVTDAVATRYGIEIKELRAMGDELNKAQSSTIVSLRDKVFGKTANPYEDIVKTMLDLPRNTEGGWWADVNHTAESAFSGVVDSWKRIKAPVASDEYMAEVKASLEKAGLKIGYPDQTAYQLANNPAEREYFSNFVNKSNGFIAALMLRTDPMNAFNNAIGSTILTSTELKSVIRAIEKGDEVTVGKLAALSKIKVPGTGDSVLSAKKLYASALEDWTKYLTGNPELAAVRESYVSKGFITTQVEQLRSSMENLVLHPNGKLGEVDSWAKRGVETLEKWSGNKLAEEMNRFISARIANKITDIGVDAGIISQREADTVINTFVNRTQGNYIASQRPSMFHGPLGQAIGLFQTYQFNLLQNLLRHVADGNTKNAITLLGMQGTIYGLNGLPAFQAINTHLVGNAAGNRNNTDIPGALYGMTGKELGDWIMYGLSSNIMINPEWKVNTYTRGDINPRFATVVPTQFEDLPVVSVVGKMLGAAKETVTKIGIGADPWTAILQGIEHAGVSRPLSGFASVVGGITNGGQVISTDNKGNVMNSHELFSIASLGRLAGAKPLDEAIARDTLYRAKAYNAARNQEISEIGESIRTHVVSGHVPTQEQITQFMEAYVKAGGRQEKFNDYYRRTIANASVNQVQALAKHGSTPYGTQLQTIMGGRNYLQDE